MKKSRITDLLDRQSSYAKMVESLNDSLSMSNYARDLLDQQSSYAKMMESLNDSLSMSNYARDLLNQQSSYAKMMESLNDSMNISSHVRDLLDQQNSFAELASASLKDSLSISNYVSEYLEQQSTFAEISASLKDSLSITNYVNDYLEQSTFAEISASLKDSLSISNYVNDYLEQSTFAEIAESLNRNFSIPENVKDILGQQPSIFETIDYESLRAQVLNEDVDDIDDEIVSYVKKIDEYEFYKEEEFEKLSPVAKVITYWLLTHVVLVLFLNYFAVATYPKIEEFLQIKKNTTTNEIKKAIDTIPEEFNIELFFDYRVINGDRVRLRELPNVDSKIITHMNKGKVVRLEERKGAWSKIAVEENMAGWVATRFLTKLSK